MKGYIGVNRRVCNVGRRGEGYVKVGYEAAVCVIAVLLVAILCLGCVVFSNMNLRTSLMIYREDIRVLNEKYQKLDEELKEKELVIKEYQDVLGAVKGRDRDNVISASRGGGRSREVERARFMVTMYTNEEGYWDKRSPYFGMMANGERTYFGAVAAPDSLPFGTYIAFDDVGDDMWDKMFNRLFEVKDRGGLIVEKVIDGEKVYCIDVYTEDKEMAFSWGRRIIDGYIIKEGYN